VRRELDAEGLSAHATRVLKDLDRACEAAGRTPPAR